MIDNQELTSKELDAFDRAYSDDNWQFSIRYNKVEAKPWEVYFNEEEGVVSPLVVSAWHTADEAKEDAANRNRAWLSSFFQEQLTQTQQKLDVAVGALEGLLADITEYQTINNLGGENNHWQVQARLALNTIGK